MLEPNYHTTENLFFTENILALEMKKTQILMNKPDCLGVSISGKILCKILIR